jgi:hypothetical protein
MDETSGDTLALTASVRGVDGQSRKLNFAFADATAKEPRYRDGVEIQGIVAAWKLPARPAAGPVTGDWLLVEPVTLAKGESLIVSIAGETKA